MIPSSFFYLRTSVYLLKKYRKCETMRHYHLSERKLKITDTFEFFVIESVCSSYPKYDFLSCIFFHFYEFSEILSRKLCSIGRKDNFIPLFCQKLFSQNLSFCFNNLLWSSFFYGFEFSKLEGFSKSFLILRNSVQKMFMRVSKNKYFYHIYKKRNLNSSLKYLKYSRLLFNFQKYGKI